MPRRQCCTSGLLLRQCPGTLLPDPGQASLGGGRLRALCRIPGTVRTHCRVLYSQRPASPRKRLGKRPHLGEAPSPGGAPSPGESALLVKRPLFMGKRLQQRGTRPLPREALSLCSILAPLLLLWLRPVVFSVFSSSETPREAPPPWGKRPHLGSALTWGSAIRGSALTLGTRPHLGEAPYP